MKNRTNLGRIPIASALLLPLLLAWTAAPAEDAPVPGELWETTTQMTMSGPQSFAIPAKKGTLCRPKGEAWNEPPAPAESNCTMSDVARSGSTMTWNMRCTNPAATGTGKMTLEGDASYTGEVTMTMSEGTMVMKLSGRRTGGECDAGAQKRQAKELEAQVTQQQAQVAQQMADMCAQAARSGQSHMFVGPMAQCKDPAQLAAFCAALSTEAGYSGAKANAGMGVDLAKAAEACHVDPKKTHDDLCARAAAAESLEFLATECPAQAQPIAQRECAGRGYSGGGVSEKYQSFCSLYAGTEMEAQPAEAQQDPAAAEKNKTVNKARKGLKGLFGK